jgi:hypothetical protein
MQRFFAVRQKGIAFGRIGRATSARADGRRWHRPEPDLAQTDLPRHALLDEWAKVGRGVFMVHVGLATAFKNCCQIDAQAHQVAAQMRQIDPSYRDKVLHLLILRVRLRSLSRPTSPSNQK